MGADGRAEALTALDAVTLRDRVASGAVRASELAAACIARIGRLEPQIGAWAWLDEDHVMAEARRLEALRASGRPMGPLHGLPVAVKDIIDTARIPTENGTAIDAGRVPDADAWVVRRLKAAGAYVLGKTVTAELASLHPGKTRNPHDPAHTPGGSSSGSAAAVAAGMAPLAIGTQTGGSVIRPAAYCGVVGYKPTFGAIPRTGILTQSPSLDTVGVFAASVEAAAMLAEALFGEDSADPATAPMPPPRLLATAMANPPARPNLAMLASLPVDPAPEPEMADAFSELVSLLSESAFEISLPAVFGEAVRQREVINNAEMAKCYHSYERRGRDRLSATLVAALDEGKAIPARDYLSARDWPGVLRAGLADIFTRCDAIVMPATPGPAPRGLGSTGPSVYNSIWTLTGLPVVTLPLFVASGGLPMGVQVIGAHGDDARLLRTARWLAMKATRTNPE